MHRINAQPLAVFVACRVNRSSVIGLSGNFSAEVNRASSRAGFKAACFVLTGRFISQTGGSVRRVAAPLRDADLSLGETRLRGYGASTTSSPARVLSACNCFSGRSSAMKRTEPSAKAKVAPPG